MGASSGGRWPGGIVPYTVDPNFTDVNVLHQALGALESATNLRFVRRLSTQGDFVEVRNASQACSSAVGRRGGRQAVGCAPAPFGFGVGAIIHELCHAVGMIHERQRSDRNSFVAIQSANIRAGQSHNFRRYGGGRNGPSYDFQSLMHYDGNAFSNGNGLTIVPLVAGTPLDGSNRPTALDTAWLDTEYPTLGVVRRSDSASGSGPVSELAVAAFPGDTDQLITAVRTASGRLMLIWWRVSQLGGVGRLADSGMAAGSATHLAIAPAPNFSTFVTAVRAASGRLLLISWNASGRAIQRRGDSGRAAGSATQIRIVSLTDNCLLTACRTAQGRLLLISWRLNADGSFTRLADSGTAAGGIASTTITLIRSAGANHLVATAVRAASGRLLLIVWNVDSNSGAIARRGDSGNAMGDGTAVAAAVAPSGHVLVSCRTRNGTLRIISFSVSADGTSLARRDDSGSLAGRIVRNALVARPYGALSAVTTAASKLMLIKLAVSNDGRIARNGDSGDQAGHAGLVEASLVAGVSAAPVVTAVKAGSGALKLISWDDLSATGELQR